MTTLLIHTNSWNNTRKETCFSYITRLFFFLYSAFVISQNNVPVVDSSASNNFNNERKLVTVIQQQKIADSLFKLTNSFIKKGNFAEALKAVEEGLSIYKLLKDNKSIGNCYNKIASIFYYQGDFPKALNYYDQSILLFKSIDFKKGLASSTNNKGAIYYYLGNYPKALDLYRRAAKINEALNDKKQAAATIKNIGGIYLELGDYENAMKNFLIAKNTYESSSNHKRLSQVLNGIGEIYTRQNDYLNALTNFEKALTLAEKTTEKQQILEVLFNLGNLYDLKKDYTTSLTYYNRTLLLAKEIKSLVYTSNSLIAIGTINFKRNKKQLAITNCKKGLKIAEDIKTISIQKDACKCLYDVYKSSNKNKKALAYFEKSITLNDSLNAKQTSDKILNMQFEKEMLIDSVANVEKERILQIRHKQEVDNKVKQRNILLVSGGFILILLIGIWSRLNYTKKSRARLQIEKDRSEHLLLNILPEEIAEELKEKGFVDAQDFESASILFTDFKAFTETASKLSPQELVEEINVCFKAFDLIMETYNIEKIKTIGDAYMAAGGISKPDTHAVKKTLLAAIDMQAFITKRKAENTLEGKPAFEMRVGIHVGPIVAGIVGVKKFQYDIWGDTVNTASRMESNGVVGKVNISQDTYLLVKNHKDLTFESRGKIDAKGKGALEMYFVSRKTAQS